MRNAVQSGWADIDVQLTRRHDLVPNLVEAVKGYMTHERETLEAVTRARTEAVSATGGASLATRAVAEMALSGAVGNLFAVAENYPTLKASQQFLAFAGADHVHGKPYCLCAAALQRVRAEVQHGASGVSAEHNGRDDGVFAFGAVRGGCGGQGERAGESLVRRFSQMGADQERFGRELTLILSLCSKPLRWLGEAGGVTCSRCRALGAQVGLALYSEATWRELTRKSESIFLFVLIREIRG